MTKSTYTDEDLNQLFQQLFHEKKKSKELNDALSLQSQQNEELKQELIKIQSKTPNEADAGLLKKLLAFYKANSGKDDEIKALTEQLSTLKERYLESQQQHQNLKAENLRLQREIEEFKNQNHKDLQGQHLREKQKIEKLAHLLQDRERRIGELQHYEEEIKHASEFKHELETEIKNLKLEQQKIADEKATLENELKESKQHAGQLERVIQFLRERSQEAQLELSQLGEEFEAAQNSLGQLNAEHKQLNEENRYCKEKLQEKDQVIAIFEKELALIKQTLIRALKEAKDIEGSYQNTVKEKASTLVKLHQAQQQIEALRESVHKLEERVEQGNRKLGDALSHIEAVETEASEKLRTANLLHKDLVEQIETLKQELQTDKFTIENLHKQLNDKEQECTDLKQMHNSIQSSLKEQEAEVRKAQLHLAKKLKELAILETKFETQQNTIQELQKTESQNLVRIAELQTTNDLFTAQQKRLEEQLQEIVKSSESQQTRWEEKYFAIYEKWQTGELRVRELEKLEEKFKQLQGFFSNVNPEIKEALPPIPIAKDEPKPSSQSLFEKSKPSPRIKTDLLE